MQVLPHHFQRIATHESIVGRKLAAWLRSNRIVLSGALFFAIIVPEFMHPLLASRYPWGKVDISHSVGLVASVAALLSAHLSLQRISLLPLVDDKITIAPTFLLSYAINSLIVSMAVGLSARYHLLTSFLVGITWYYIVALMRARFSFPKLAVIGEIPVLDELRFLPIEWLEIDVPSLPRDVSGIVFDSGQPGLERYEALFTRAVLRGIPVYEVDSIREMTTGRVRSQRHPAATFGAILPSMSYSRARRAIDFAVAVPALVIALPVMIFAALAICIESRGSPVFRQRRLGYQGRPFTCYKLRTMQAGARGPSYTQAQDPRITRVGRFLRQTRLDELPQIVNILKGDMGWIGPRPESIDLARQYRACISSYGYRHLVRPGITGWAAVHQGNVALQDAATKKLEYDFFYIKHFSPWLDFLIVLMTVRTVLTGFGAK